jgi:hypothetical protein
MNDPVKNFEAILSKFCCANCKFLVKKKCTEKNARKHNVEKRELKGAFLKIYNEGINDPNISDGRREMLIDIKKKADNINNAFVCEEFD